MFGSQFCYGGWFIQFGYWFFWFCMFDGAEEKINLVIQGFFCDLGLVILGIAGSNRWRRSCDLGFCCALKLMQRLSRWLTKVSVWWLSTIWVLVFFYFLFLQVWWHGGGDKSRDFGLFVSYNSWFLRLQVWIGGEDLGI